MKIHIPNESEQKIGGGWTFIRNIKKALKDDVQFVNEDDCDIYFIVGATMVSRDAVERAKKNGKRIVLRVDNALKNSRNRGTGMPRMYDFAQMANKVIYQSSWARSYLSPFLGKDGPVIVNGCDQSIFTKDGPKLPKSKTVYLYTRYSRDETKNWHEAWYEYQMLHRKKPNSILWIVGRFSGDNRTYNFDFFNGEAWDYLGVVTDPNYMAMIYRTADCLIYPYYNDACSNTLIEARSCGTKIKMTPSGDSGGTKEILNQPIKFLSLDKMGKRYMKVFRELVYE